MRSTRIRLMTSISVAILLTLIACPFLQAGILTIKVAEQDPDATSAGPAIQGATVCFAQQNGSATARQTTDNQGRVSFPNVPQGNIFVAVFKTGYISRSLTFFMPANDTFQQIVLVLGNGPAIVCPAPSANAIAGELSTTIAYGNTDPSDIHASGKIQYVITARDTSGNGVANVRLDVAFPAGFSNLSGSGGGFTCSTGHPGQLICQAPQLAVNSPKTITVIAFAPPSVIGNSQVFTIGARIDPSDTIEEGNEQNNVDQINTTVLPKGPDLTVDLTGSDTAASAGQQVEYQVNVKNIGDRATPTSVSLDTGLPQGISFLSAGFQNCSTLNTTVNTVAIHCDIGNLTAGATRSGQIIGTVQPTVPDGVVTFAANVDARHAITEFLENNNGASVNTTLAGLKPDLVITSTKFTPWACHLATRDPLCCTGFILEATVKNTGPGSSSSTQLDVITDTGQLGQVCPDNTFFVPSDCTCHAGTSCRSTSSGSRCSVPSLDPGSSTTIKVGYEEFRSLSFHYTVTFKVDPDNNVTEEHNDNNKATMTVD